MPLHRWLDVVNKPVVILSKYVEHEKGRTLSVPSSSSHRTNRISCLFYRVQGQLQISAILVKMSMASPGAMRQLRVGPTRLVR